MQNNKNLQPQELAIAIAAKNLNPTILNLDFLKYTGIIPSDWEPARQPVYTNQAVQLVFKSGISIVAQPNRIVFVEAIGSKDIKELQVAEIAFNFTQKLSEVEYQAVGINPIGYISFDSDKESYRYLSQTLLAPGSWQDFGEAPVRAGIDLSYSLERCQLNLKINQALLKFPEQSVAAILFSGNFLYQLKEDNRETKRTELQQLIQNWQNDLETYQKLVEDKFLPSVAEEISVIPMLAQVH